MIDWSMKNSVAMFELSSFQGSDLPLKGLIILSIHASAWGTTSFHHRQRRPVLCRTSLGEEKA